MKHGSFKAPLSVALGLFLMTMAAPIALADPPGYDFQDFNTQPSVAAASVADPPAVAGNSQDSLTTARQAVQLAQHALNQAQQALQQTR